MRSYKLNPFATFVESRLIHSAPEYAVFHRLTGQLIQLEPAVRSLLNAVKNGSPLSVSPEQLARLRATGHQIGKLIDLELLISEGHDPLVLVVDHYVNRPLQNPAITFQSETGEVWVVSISMAEKIFSPERGKISFISEERFSELATEVLLAADGTNTLRQIHATLRRDEMSPLEDQEFRDAIEFLSTAERQLIKCAPTAEGFANPFYPACLVPRNFHHALRWTEREPNKSIGDFHVEGIEDALWEFDIVEPTVNHGLRFPTKLLDGLDYGTRFCDSVLENAFLALDAPRHFEILEVGGGTGSFARSFIKRARARLGSLSYQILDLSPALSESQRRLLNDIEPPVGHISQDATKLDLPGRKFDLIVLNEVIADFPVAAVERSSAGSSTGFFRGEGATYVEKYELAVNDAPERFYVNAGVLEFLERAWSHLNSGGVLVLSEYGSTSRYPVETFHLNHAEFTIHFGHVSQCARKIGFDCRLQTLTEFLGIDDRMPVLCGREEHILCLNHVLQKYGKSLPFGLFSEADFKAQFSELASRFRLQPIRFLPLSNKFHYGPNPGDFFVLILAKPGR